MFARLLTSALLVACCAVMVAAQDKEAAFDALYWLPDGTYGYLAFTQWAGMQKTAVFADYGDLLSGSQFNNLFKDSPLPESAREGLEWICMARLMRLRLADEEELAQMSQVRTIITMSDDGEMKTRKERPSREEVLAHGVRNDEGSLWVVGFDDAAGLVKAAVAEGWLSRTGEKFMGRPIYALSGKRGEERDTGYAYATVSNELLLADDIEMLKEMVASGMGQGSSFVYSAEFNDLAPFIPDFGQSWRVSVMRAERKEKIDLWADLPELDERVEKLEKELNEGLQYEITSYEFSDAIVEKSICIFGSDEYAAESAKEIEERLQNEQGNAFHDSESVSITVMGDDGEVDKGQTQKLNRLFHRSSQLAGHKAGKTEVVLEGNIVTTIFTWGERQLQTMRFLRETSEQTGSVQIQIDIQKDGAPKELPHRP